MSIFSWIFGEPVPWGDTFPDPALGETEDVQRSDYDDFVAEVHGNVEAVSDVSTESEAAESDMASDTDTDSDADGDSDAGEGDNGL